jgi:glyoxylase-like metal-dependent hydrolase (beta-lactamase superfamily II)
MLEPVAPGVSVWRQSPAGFGRPNAAVVVDDDGITVIDTLMVPSQTAPFAAAVAALGAPVRRVVCTSSHMPFVGGTSAFRLAAVYGSPQMSALLDQPPNVAGYQHLFPELAAEFEGLGTRPVSHLVTEAAWLSPTVIAVPATGQIAQNLVVQVPEVGVVVAGAMAPFGVTPLCFDGDPAAWAESLETILTYGATVVPGWGPVGGEDEVRALQAYLWACVDAGGDAAAIPAGPWDVWTDRRFDAVNVERAARLAAGDPSPPSSALALLGMA